jgi:hypothetical protein
VIQNPGPHQWYVGGENFFPAMLAVIGPFVALRQIGKK